MCDEVKWEYKPGFDLKSESFAFPFKEDFKIDDEFELARSYEMTDHDNPSDFYPNHTSEDYHIKVEVWKYKDPEKHYWDYTLYKVYKGDDYILTINRNYHPSGIGNFIFAKYDGDDYLIGTSHYMAIFCCNLSKKTIKHYFFTNLAFKNTKYEQGLCVTDLEMEEIEGIYYLRMRGCYWGAPYEIINMEISDLSDWTHGVEAGYRGYEDDDYDDDEEEEDK